MPRTSGMIGAGVIITDALTWLKMADEEGIRTTKTELVALISHTNYAFVLGVVNSIIFLRYAEEIKSQDITWVRITAKGLSYLGS